MTRRITDTQFKSLLSESADTVASDLTVVKAGPSLMDPIQGSRRLKWVISTEAVDRMGDVIKLSGWKLDNYEKGGSVLWAHDPTVLPVAKPIKTYVEGPHLISVAEYPTKDVSEFANTVYELAKGGFLRGSSIGMRPIKYVRDDVRANEEHPYPMVFVEQELLEWSHTPIPANPEALLSAKSMGVDLNPLRSWSERALDENISVCGVTRSTLEKTYSLTSGDKIVSIPNIIKADAPQGDAPPAEAIETPTDVAMECNAMLDQFLAMADDFAEAAVGGTIDAEKLNAAFTLMQSLVQPAQQSLNMPESGVQERAAEANVEPVEAKSADETKEGFDRMNSFSFEDLTEQDIREVARDVISAELRKRKR